MPWPFYRKFLGMEGECCLAKPGDSIRQGKALPRQSTIPQYHALAECSAAEK